jgi:hypothetical protein
MHQRHLNKIQSDKNRLQEEENKRIAVSEIDDYFRKEVLVLNSQLGLYFRSRFLHLTSTEWIVKSKSRVLQILAERYESETNVEDEDSLFCSNTCHSFSTHGSLLRTRNPTVGNR